jgi:hypothetical protein
MYYKRRGKFHFDVYNKPWFQAGDPHARDVVYRIDEKEIEYYIS